MKNFPTEKVKQFGEDLATALIDASIRKSFHGLGGCLEYNINDFAPEFHKYITEYLKTQDNSLAIIYAGMRTKELEN